MQARREVLPFWRATQHDFGRGSVRAGGAPGHLLFAATQRVHFIGIGGIGMSGIAEILLTMGYVVSGSDLRRSATTDRLLGMGARIFEGHAAANVAAAATSVVTSSAVSATNPEVVRGADRGEGAGDPEVRRCWRS